MSYSSPLLQKYSESSACVVEASNGACQSDSHPCQAMAQMK